MSLDGLNRAFDELRFGAECTLNLRSRQPSASEAAFQAEQWLRRLQVEGRKEALVITGRGNQSPGGFSPVREAVAKLLPSLRRRGVISGYIEHTPGSFVVTFASVTTMLEAGRRRRERSFRQETGDRSSLGSLAGETQKALRDLALATLAGLGVRRPTAVQIETEVMRQFSRLVSALPDDGSRESRLMEAIARALEELEES